MNIHIKKESGNTFLVSVTPDTGFTTEHHVTVYPEYVNMLTGDTLSQEELLEASFQFLLQRESNDSVLPEFDLPDISGYFPEYEQHIRDYVAARKS